MTNALMKSSKYNKYDLKFNQIAVKNTHGYNFHDKLLWKKRLYEKFKLQKSQLN